MGVKKLQKRKITAEWIQTISSQSECNFLFLSNNYFKYSLLSADWVITSVWGWRRCERETSWASRGFLRAEIAVPYLIWWECRRSLLCSRVLIFLNRWIVTSKKGLSKEGGFPGSWRLGIKLSRKMKYNPLVSYKQGALYFGTGFTCFMYGFQMQFNHTL